MPRTEPLAQRISRVRQAGPRALPMKLWTTFYRRVVLMARPLDGTIPDAGPAESLDIRMLSEIDAFAYRRFRPDQDPDVVPLRLRQGHQCFAVWQDARIVHAAWAAINRVYIPYLRRHIILAPGIDVFVYDSFTLLSHRHHGLAHARAFRILQHYRQAGYRRAMALIAVENKAALGPSLGSGYRPQGMYRCLRFGPWQCTWSRSDSGEPLPALIRAPDPTDEQPHVHECV